MCSITKLKEHSREICYTIPSHGDFCLSVFTLATPMLLQSSRGIKYQQHFFNSCWNPRTPFNLLLHLGLESGTRFLQAVDFVHESWHRWGVHLRQRLSQKRYCLKFLSSKFDFEEQSAAIWRQLVETHLTAASLSSLLPFSVPRAQEFSLHRAQQHRPIVVYNPQTTSDKLHSCPI